MALYKQLVCNVLISKMKNLLQINTDFMAFIYIYIYILSMVLISLYSIYVKLFQILYKLAIKKLLIRLDFLNTVRIAPTILRYCSIMEKNKYAHLKIK